MLPQEIFKISCLQPEVKFGNTFDFKNVLKYS